MLGKQEKRKCFSMIAIVKVGAGTMYLNFLSQAVYPLVAPRQTTAEEVLLTIELTASVDERALPSELMSAIEVRKMPWIRIHKTPTLIAFEHKVISNNLQKQLVPPFRKFKICSPKKSPFNWYIPSKHIVPVPTATTQAGHHPTYQLYDRPNGAGGFLHALTIDGAQVASHAPSGQTPNYNSTDSKGKNIR